MSRRFVCSCGTLDSGLAAGALRDQPIRPGQMAEHDNVESFQDTEEDCFSFRAISLIWAADPEPRYDDSVGFPRTQEASHQLARCLASAYMAGLANGKPSLKLLTCHNTGSRGNREGARRLGSSCWRQVDQGAGLQCHGPKAFSQHMLAAMFARTNAFTCCWQAQTRSRYGW